jgi:hypothetical protein
MCQTVGPIGFRSGFISENPFWKCMLILIRKWYPESTPNNYPPQNIIVHIYSAPPVRRNRLITHGKPSTVVCRTPPFGHTCEPRMPPYTTSKTRPGYAPQPGVLDTVQPQTTRSKLHQQQLRTQRTSQTNNQKAPHALPHLDGKQPVQQRNAPPPSTRR